MSIEKRSDKVIQKLSIALAAGMLLYCCIVIAYKRPWIDGDLHEGLFSLNNYIKGLGFHQSFSILENYKITHSLLSYWAPGEYAYSWFFASMLHLNIADGIFVTNIIFLVAGILSYYYLLKHFRLSNTIIALSIFMIVVQRFFHGSLLRIAGVDLFLIVFCSLAILLFEKYYATEKKQKQFIYLSLLLLVLLMGLFCKNSFMLFIVSASAYYFIVNSYKIVQKHASDSPRPTIVKVLLPGLIAFIAAATFYLLFYSQSRTPISQRMGTEALHPTLLKLANIGIKPAIQTLGSPFTFDAFLLRFPSPQHSFFSYVKDYTAEGIIISIILLIPLVLSIVHYYKDRKNEVFPLLGIFFILGHFLFFSAAIVRQSDVYAEDRLFLPMMLFVTPVYAHTLLYGKLFLRWSIRLFLFVSIAFSIIAIPVTLKYYKVCTLVHSDDLFNGFMIRSDKEHPEELKEIGQVLTKKYPSRNLLITNHGQFFLVQASLPSISLDLATYKNFNAFVSVNDEYFRQHNIATVSVITRAGQPIIADASIILEQAHLTDYSLYVLRARQ